MQCLYSYWLFNRALVYMGANNAAALVDYFLEIDFQSLTFFLNILHPQYLPRALCVAEFNILVT